MTNPVGPEFFEGRAGFFTHPLGECVASRPASTLLSRNGPQYTPNALVGLIK